MDTTGLSQWREIKGRKKSFCPSFPPSLLPFCCHPISHVTETLYFFPFFRVYFLFLSFSASRICTCRIHACLITDVFNLTDESYTCCEGLKNERNSARRKNQTLEKEIQELKKKSEDDQRENQALQKEQQEKIRQFQRKNEELEGKVTNRTSELKELLDEIIQQQRG